MTSEKAIDGSARVCLLEKVSNPVLDCSGQGIKPGRPRLAVGCDLVNGFRLGGRNAGCLHAATADDSRADPSSNPPNSNGESQVETPAVFRMLFRIALNSNRVQCKPLKSRGLAV